MDEKYAEYLHKWSLNVADVCRLCVNAKITMKSVTQNSQIACIYEDIIGIKFDTSNVYPHLICQECQHALETTARHVSRLRQVDAFWQRYLFSTGKPEPDTNLAIEMVKVETLESNQQQCSTGDEGRDIFENLFDNATQFIKIELETKEDILPKKMWKDFIVRSYDDNIIFSHPTIDVFLCQQCGQSHACTNSLLLHLEHDHGNTNTFICDYCGDQYNSKLKLRRHFTEHMKFGCSVCQKLFNSKTSLSVHIKLHQRTIDDMVKCHLCQKTFIDKGTYRDHVRYTHTDVYDAKCPVCEKVYETPKRMRVHMIRHTKEKRFQCSECPKLFMHKQEVKVHMRVHTNERPYVCDICGMSFKAMRSLQKHHLSHNSEANNISSSNIGPAQPFTCPLCADKCFAHSSTLSKHLKHQHPFEATTMWQSLLQRICIRCNQIFPSVESIQHHNEQLHQRFQCEICKKYFGAEETLQYHVQGHSTQERRFKCDVCGASFLKNAHLQIHKRRTHQNERPHQCHICQKGFVSNSDLMGHIKITHNKEKSHVCSVCEKPYPTAGSLRQHEQKHSGVYRYRCTLCVKNFTTSQQFAMHNLRTHKQATEIN